MVAGESGKCDGNFQQLAAVYFHTDSVLVERTTERTNRKMHAIAQNRCLYAS